MEARWGSSAAAQKPQRVAIVHQGFVPPYRVRFFERLATESEIEYVVFYGDPPPGTGHHAARAPFSFRAHRVRNRSVGVFGRSVVWQPVIGPIAGGRFDGAVLGAELKFPANAVVGLAFGIMGRAAIVWGQGYEKADDHGRGPLRRAGDRLKAFAARRATGYLAYTDGGADHLVAAGVDPARITVVRNTLDMTTHERLEIALRDADESALRHALGLRGDSVVLVYLGRVYQEKRVDELVALARELPARVSRPVEVVVIGDGPDLERVRGLADDLPGLRFVGAVYDDSTVAEWLRIASALVIPGKVGLAVNHALAHGVPVLTRASDLHAPEVEYLRSGENGLIVPGPFEAFVDVVASFVEADDRRAQLAAGALASRDSLGLDTMVAAFDHGVRQALRRRRER